MTDDAREPWHLDKRVNVGHIVATLMLAAALFGYIVKMDRRMTVLEERAAQARIDDERAEMRLREAVTRLEIAIDRLSDRLDRGSKR